MHEKHTREDHHEGAVDAGDDGRSGGTTTIDRSVPHPSRDVELPEDQDSAQDFLRALGKLFKRARERAGLTQQEAAERLNFGVDLISAIERARRIPQEELLHAADDLFGADGMLTTVIPDLREAKKKVRTRHPAWFRLYATLESHCVELHSYTTMVIPGLLQTEAHVRALHEVRRPPLHSDVIEQRVAARIARQPLLLEPGSWPPPTMTFVVEESVLHRKLGGTEVHQEQLRHLLRVSALPWVELQVMPMKCADHPGLAGSFSILTPRGRPQVAYTEGHGRNELITDPERVRLMAGRYGSIRAQALTPRQSTTLIESLLEER
ncbi:helix-turn-helix transcriptional regulator [Streptomyces calidiresistens]|uniref:Helix-turn-helix domain-containing protein n=1 Tax=Streptomyces calidiresistens TaxID=1485586 RepID=A0A7W3XXL8_9ACTN|nr:helix-turn-helix transcriptional regulator [Streptomyces calidiresistens]MBB0231230.1 helix-turn-helix domain-containing protein [Streptomyces calidiresistens]